MYVRTFWEIFIYYLFNLSFGRFFQAKRRRQEKAMIFKYLENLPNSTLSYRNFP